MGELRLPVKRALLVEDDPMVRNVVEACLRRAGFETLNAEPCVNPGVTSDCDLRCYSDDARPDVVVAVLLPRACSGIEAAFKALRRWAGVKILLTSTLPPDAWPENAAQLFRTLPTDSYIFLAKPFTPAQLNSALVQLRSIEQS